MDTQSGLIVIFGVGAGTLALRVTPFLIGRRIKFPKFFLEWLIYLSLGITAGMVSKNLFVQNGGLFTDDLAFRLCAVALGGLLHWKYRNVLLSLFSGVGFATVLKYFLI